MRKIAIIGVAVVSALTFGGSAQAATQTSVSSYDDVEFGGTGFHVAFGQVFSSKASCSASRKVKLVATKQGGKPKLLDSGVTTAEGAISGGYLKSRVAGAKLEFVVPATRKCAGASVRVMAAPNPERPTTRATANSVIATLAVNGKKKDGAFAGLILLQSGISKLKGGMPPAKCFGGRKISLYGDGDLFDHGKTSHNGTWALHLTRKESKSTAEFTVKLRKSKAPDGTKCGAASTTFPGIAP